MATLDMESVGRNGGAGSPPSWSRADEWEGEPLSHSKGGLVAADELAARLEDFADRQRAMQGDIDLLLRPQVVDFGNVQAVRSDVGYLLVPSADKTLVLALVEAEGSLEHGTLAVILDLVKPGDLIIDVGADVGTIALPVAAALRGHGRVIAVEPVPKVARLLSTTAMLNGLTDVLVVEQCVAGDRFGLAPFYIDQRTRRSSRRAIIDDTMTRIETPVRPLDGIVPSGEPVRIVKIDVGGDELNVWQGMKRLLDENVEMAIVIKFGRSQWKQRGTAPAEWLAGLGVPYDAVWEIEEETGSLHPLRLDGLEDLRSINLLIARAGIPRSLRHRAG